MSSYTYPKGLFKFSSGRDDNDNTVYTGPDADLRIVIDRYREDESNENKQAIENFDTSEVTSMRNLFRGLKKFNGKLSKWKTPKVTDMSSMFRGATAFNQPFTLDTSKVTNMNCMFYDAVSFNQPLNMDTSKVTDMGWMFRDARAFNQALNFTDTSKVKVMRWMFVGASSFKQDLSGFDLSGVKAGADHIMETQEMIKAAKAEEDKQKKAEEERQKAEAAEKQKKASAEAAGYPEATTSKQAAADKAAAGVYLIARYCKIQRDTARYCKLLDKARLDMGYDIREVTYKPLANFVDQPPPGELKPCSDYVLSECAEVMPECTRVQETVQQVSLMVSSKLGDPAVKHLLDTAKVTIPMFFAILLYTIDLSSFCFNSEREQNWYWNLNSHLRKREPKFLRACHGYLYYLMTGLDRLPPYGQGTAAILYRGIDKEGAKLAKETYSDGRRIHWSGFSSATLDIKKAIEFADYAGDGGLILRIKTLQRDSKGRDIRQLSGFGEEAEILLLPNFTSLVTNVAEYDGELKVEVIDLKETPADMSIQIF